MNPKKYRKAGILFSEMGGIDDFLLQEALIYRPIKRSRTSRLWIVAACLATSFALLFCGVLIGNLAGIKNESPQINEDLAPPTSQTPLDDFLTAHGEEIALSQVHSAEQLDLFHSPTVVWQLETGGDFYVSRALTEGELQKLTSYAGRGTEVGEKAPEQTYRVWILAGDGTVISPYLKASAGNVGTTLFDYEPEILPTEDFTSCLEALLRS